MARIRRDALRYGAGARASEDGSSLVSVSLESYLDRVAASDPVRSQVMAWWAISGNGDPKVVSAAEFLASCAYGGGVPEGMLDKLRDTLVPGASVLVERMLEGSGAAIDLDWPAAFIRQDAAGVIVTARDGRSVSGRFAILAAPLNALGQIEFGPPLQPAKAAAIARRHAGASVKLWMKTRGIRPGTLATGGNGALPWMFCEREAAGGTALVVGFGLAGEFDPSRRSAVLAALHHFFPGAELIGWAWHDWVADPYSQGTWVALPADAVTMADPARWQPEGRVAFAGSDIAAQEPGWFEAAITSGEEAALSVASALSRNERIPL
jgi:monoamine oxidase